MDCVHIERVVLSGFLVLGHPYSQSSVDSTAAREMLLYGCRKYSGCSVSFIKCHVCLLFSLRHIPWLLLVLLHVGWLYTNWKELHQNSKYGSTVYREIYFPNVPMIVKKTEYALYY